MINKLLKKKKSATVLIVLALIGFSFANCKDEIQDDEDIKVESIQLDENLKQGVTIEIGGESINISGKVTVLPENATNKKETYSSSNTNVATVDAGGNIIIIAEGSTVIKVTVGGKSDQFTLIITGKEQVKVTGIQIETHDLEIAVGESVNISNRITVLPVEAENKNLVFESNDESIAIVDENGNITALEVGTAKITIESEDVPSVKNFINVTVQEFKGDYPRDTWTVAASHALFTGEGNFLTGAIDSDETTIFALVRPGKSFGGISVTSADNGGCIYFVIDMKEKRKVNYFRIRHRNSTNIYLRYMMIEEILGSNDGEHFTVIASDVVVTDAGVIELLESPNISIPVSNYRYLKFYCQKNECFYSMSQGSTAQLSELYLGNE